MVMQSKTMLSGYFSYYLSDYFLCLFKCIFQFQNGFFRIFFFFKQSDKAATDDSSGSELSSSLECRFIGDAKPYHQRIVQVHVFDLFEISTFLFVEVLLCACSSCG